MRPLPVDESERDSRETVLLYGRSSRSSLAASYGRAFRELGWRVECVEADPAARDLAWWARSDMARSLMRPSLRLRRLASRRRNESFNDWALERRPDLVLVINGAFLMADTVASIRRAGIPVVVFHPDAPLPGNPNHRPEHLPVVREADVCFIWSRRLMERLDEEGARRVAYLPFAWDPKVFPYIKSGSQPGPDVVFVGGWDEQREVLLEPVARHFDLQLWGPDYWGSRTRPGSPLRRCWQGRALRGREAAEVVARAGIALNVLREQNLPDGTNMRTFEVPGAGGFLLATRTRGATELFPESEAGAYFDTREELLQKIAYYLERPEKRQAIARRAHEITAREHRYVHRAQRILREVEAAGA